MTAGSSWGWDQRCHADRGRRGGPGSGRGITLKGARLHPARGERLGGRLLVSAAIAALTLLPTALGGNGDHAVAQTAGPPPPRVPAGASPAAEPTVAPPPAGEFRPPPTAAVGSPRPPAATSPRLPAPPPATPVERVLTAAPSAPSPATEMPPPVAPIPPAADRSPAPASPAPARTAVAEPQPRPTPTTTLDNGSARVGAVLAGAVLLLGIAAAGLWWLRHREP